MAATNKSLPNTACVRLTQRQIADAEVLDEQDLIDLALDALHSLSHRAKTNREQARSLRRRSWRETNEEALARIRALKAKFLRSLVKAGLAYVEVFDAQRTQRNFECEDCARSWTGHSSECRRCGGFGQLVNSSTETATWAAISAGNYRWYQPPEEVTPAILAVATRVAPQKPVELARDIPKVGLTIEAQHRIIELAITRLEERWVGRVDACDHENVAREPCSERPGPTHG